MSSRTLLAGLGVLTMALSAMADWKPGDPYKMHFPQLPNPLGWDVAVTTPAPPPPAAVADDWLCTQSGPVSDIHIWFSLQGDLPLAPAQIAFTIYSDVPAGTDPNPMITWSHPGNPLWSQIFAPPQFTIVPAGTGSQGWLDPANMVVLPNDHMNIWQLNVNTIVNPFPQTQGTIYWLGVNFEPTWGPAGWKTSINHFNDDAVWWNPNTVNWNELIDPVSGASLDMAFVITPEPGTYALVAGLGLVAFATLRRFRTK